MCFRRPHLRNFLIRIAAFPQLRLLRPVMKNETWDLLSAPAGGPPSISDETDSGTGGGGEAARFLGFFI